MEDKSYYKGLETGLSDGTLSGNRGVQENYRRKVAVHDEAKRLGEKIFRAIVGLFLHPVFCFVGFWLLGFGLLLTLAPKIGAGTSLNDMPTWYGWTAAAVPIVAAILLRKIVPKLMAAALYIGIAGLAVLMVIQVIEMREERAARNATQATDGPPALAAPPRTPAGADVQRALIDASRPGITSTPPSEGPVNEVETYYCTSVPVAERPDWCP
jgi:hypothetical protein